jgi:hypothetical protein
LKWRGTWCVCGSSGPRLMLARMCDVPAHLFICSCSHKTSVCMLVDMFLLFALLVCFLLTHSHLSYSRTSLYGVWHCLPWLLADYVHTTNVIGLNWSSHPSWHWASE